MALGWRSQYLRYQEFFLNILAVYRSRRDLKMFLEIILSLGAISFFSIFALKPTLLTIASLYTQIKSREETLAKMNQKIQDIGAARGAISRESRLPLVESAVPNDPAIQTLVRQIEGLSASHSIKLLGISIGEVTLVGPEAAKKRDTQTTPLPEDANEVDFSITASGDYSSFLALVSDLERVRRPVKIEVVGINSSKVETGKVLVLVINGRTPYLGKTENLTQK